MQTTCSNLVATRPRARYHTQKRDLWLQGLTTAGYCRRVSRPSMHAVAQAQQQQPTAFSRSYYVIRNASLRRSSSALDGSRRLWGCSAESMSRWFYWSNCISFSYLTVWLKAYLPSRDSLKRWWGNKKWKFRSVLNSIKEKREAEFEEIKCGLRRAVATTATGESEVLLHSKRRDDEEGPTGSKLRPSINTQILLSLWWL